MEHNNKEEIEEKPDYFIDDLVRAFFDGPKFTEYSVKLHDILADMREIADEYARREEIDDDYMETGLQELMNDLVKEIYKFKTNRGD
jgi:hypothetical protein